MFDIAALLFQDFLILLKYTNPSFFITISEYISMSFILLADVI